MCWAEKLVVALAALLFLLGLLVGQSSGNPADVWLPAWGHIYLYLLVILGLPLWIFLRLVDALTGGPARRRGRIIVRRL